MRADDIRQRRFTRLDAIEEIAHVIDDRVEFPNARLSVQVVIVVDLPVFATEWLRLQCVNRSSRDLAAIDEQSSRIAGKENSIVARVGDRHRHSVGKPVGDVKVDRHVVAVCHVWHSRCPTDLDWLGIDRPLRDINVMSTPIGHLTA